LNQELEQRVAERTADLEAELAERKRTEAALRQSEAHFRLLVDGVRDYAILTLDMEERISSWNPGAERIFDYSEAEVIGQSFDLLFTPKDGRQDTRGGNRAGAGDRARRRRALARAQGWQPFFRQRRSNTTAR